MNFTYSNDIFINPSPPPHTHTLFSLFSLTSQISNYLEEYYSVLQIEDNCPLLDIIVPVSHLKSLTPVEFAQTSKIVSQFLSSLSTTLSLCVSIYLSLYNPLPYCLAQTKINFHHGVTKYLVEIVY